MTAVLQGLATANPARYATQREVCEFLEAHFRLAPAERELYRHILLDGPIHGRHIAVDYDEEICCQGPDDQIARFLKHGRSMAREAARKALDQAATGPADVVGIIVNTCTGYLCPGLSSYLAEDLGLTPLTEVLDVTGMGCGAAIPNLRTASRIAGYRDGGSVLSVSVEVCSATFFMGQDPDLVVSNSIFGDGASAAVLTPGDATASSGLVRLVDFESGVFPKYREYLRYKTLGGRLRNVLHKAVPVIAARAVAEISRRLLDRRGMSQADIDWWIVHPGGSSVLDRVARALDLRADQLRFSHEVFAQFGNMSSPSVMFVLDRVLREGHPRPGQKGLMISFGAGFTAFAALVEFL
jgi:predicted naringenin-chalcone synthase